MWSGLSQFADALKEQAESVVRDAGLDNQLVRSAPFSPFPLGEDCNVAQRYRIPSQNQKKSISTTVVRA